MSEQPPGPPGPSGLPPGFQPPATYDVPGPLPAPPERRRAPIVAAAVAAALVVGLAVAVPVVVSQTRAEEERQAAGPADLDEVQVFEDLPNDHTPGDVDYETVPPVGGPHDQAWLECGAYDEPLRDENVVHDLEHGTVWITYDPDLGGDDVSALEEVLPDNGIMSPYPGLPAPVVVTVWERRLELDGADDPRLPLFLAVFSDGHTAPEPFASCAGGLTRPDGGTSTQV